MKNLIFALLIGLASSLTGLKGQTEEIVSPDSEYRAVPFPQLQYGSFHIEPVSIIGKIATFEVINNSSQNPNEFNGTKLDFPMFMVNLDQKKCIFPKAVGATMYGRQNSIYNKNVFYSMSKNGQKIYKTIIVDTTGIETETIYNNNGDGLIGAFCEGLGDEIVIGEQRKQIKVLNQDLSVKKVITTNAEMVSMTKWNNLIVMGGKLFGVIQSVNTETGEIINMSTKTIETHDPAFVQTINGNVYAEVKKGIYKFNGNKDWDTIVLSSTQMTLKKDEILGEWTFLDQNGTKFILRNDSVIKIPDNPLMNTIWVDSYIQTYRSKYGNTFNHAVWGFIPYNGKVYCTGQGFIGTIEKVPTQTSGFKKSNLALISIYPNPATETITITNLTKETLVTVINSLGQPVLLVTTTESIDISSLNSGNLYFMKINGFNPIKFYKK